MSAAKIGYPNEAVGLYLQESVHGAVWLHQFEANATRTSFWVPPRELIRFMYHAEHSNWRIVGTFHSHPHGVGAFSVRDEGLVDLAAHHVLASFDGVCWEIHWGVRYTG